MPDELDVLKTVAGQLEEAGISYMVTGSIAANFYSQPRMTRDIDIVIDLSAGQAEKLYSVFKGDFYVDKGAIEEALTNRSMFNIIHFAIGVKVDLIIRKEGEYRDIEFSRKLKREMEGFALFMVSPEDLVLSKLVWAKESLSEVQLADVRNIVSFNRDNLDFDYLREWAQKLSVLESFKKAAT